MSAEGNPVKTPTIEDLQEDFKKELDTILYKELTVENISTFADDALNELVAFNDKVLRSVSENPLLKSESSGVSNNAQEQEDEAYTKLALPNIGDILDQVVQVRDTIQDISQYIEVHKQYTDKVITPPDSNPVTVGENGTFREPRILPRLLTLMYILETDFGISKDTVSITEGNVTPDMVREEPYMRIVVSELNRAVYLCDEEGNVSYVFDTEKLKQHGISLNEVDIDTKNEKNDLIAHFEGVGMRFSQTKNWRAKVTQLLGEEIPVLHLGENNGSETKKRSEFIERKKLAYVDFEAEVREVYQQAKEDEKANVGTWYKEECKKHAGWPSNPFQYYTGEGWKSWLELVDKEKKVILPFTTFLEEVRESYKKSEGEKVNVQAWYSEECKNHVGWPVVPYNKYENNGWQGWSELVEKEKLKYISFSDFQEEVRKTFQAFEQEKRDIQAWYKEEYKSHPGWSSVPYLIYKEKGWKNWATLVGREKHLSFSDFQVEVREMYRTASEDRKKNVDMWYREECKNHKKWPSAPSIIYRDKGWQGWKKLVEKG